MFKKIIVSVVLLTSVLLMVACGKTTYTVTFDSQGGTAVTALVVEKGMTVEEPTDPTKESDALDSAWNFTGWYTTATASTSSMFDFATEIAEDITLYAGWTQQIVVRFNSKTDATVTPAYVPVGGGSVTAPTAPTRTGFTFGGWFYGKPGSTWLEPDAVSFPIDVTVATQLYAYWIPNDSSAVDYTADQTYNSSFTDMDTDPIMNPMTYHWAYEDTLMNFITTDLYGTDVNWDKAIEDDLATAKADFSLIDESNIGALERENVKYGAEKYPIAVGGLHDGEDGTDQNDKYSEAISRTISATTYRYTLRDDIYWEDGTNVTANDYFYSYFQYIDPVQNNFRADSYYPSASRNSGMKVVNSRGYFLQGTEIGLGEATPGSLAGDYGYAKLTTYSGPNPPYSASYANLFLDEIFGASLSRDLYISLEDFNASGYALGDTNVPLTPELTALYGLGAHWLVDFDLHTDVVTNPNYVAPKGTYWPAVAKEAVGFKVIDDYTFEMEFEVPVQHASAMSLGDFNLVHPATYEDSLDANGTNSTYGTSATPPVSYGPYVLKTWDTNQKMVFNKNYDSFMHQYYNYKARSIEFYPDVDSRMTAFEDGLLDVAGLNQTFYSQYVEDPNLKAAYDGYPQYLMFSAVPYESDTYNAATKDAIKDLDFRQAFFFGFNRIEYTSTIYAPNVPTLLTYSSNATQYDNDPSWYVNTPEYAAMLEDLDIDYDTFGYDPVKAQTLFNTAYAKWDAVVGNDGPITLTWLTADGAEQARIDDYIISHYETLFGTDKIAFVKDSYTQGVSSDKQDLREFDITLTGIGTGQTTNVSVMLPILGLYYVETYQGSDWGFNSPEELGIPADAFVILEANKLDLRATWTFLKGKTDWDATTDEGTLEILFDILDANDGYFIGDLSVLNDFGIACTYIWAGLAPQYDGDVDDRNTVTRAFDRLALEYVQLVPTAGRAGATVYSDDVVDTWPAYHNIMIWGQSRYWYLSSDSDFS